MKLMKFDSQRHQIAFDTDGMPRVYRRKRQPALRNLTTGFIVDRVGDTLASDVGYRRYGSNGTLVFDGDEYVPYSLWTLEDITDRIDWNV